MDIREQNKKIEQLSWIVKMQKGFIFDLLLRMDALEERVGALEELHLQEQPQGSMFPAGRPPKYPTSHIMEVLDKVGGNRTQAAKLLKMSTRSVRKIANGVSQRIGG